MLQSLFHWTERSQKKNEGEDAKEKDRLKAKFFWGKWKSDESFERMDQEQAALLGLEFEEDTPKYVATRKNMPMEDYAMMYHKDPNQQLTVVCGLGPGGSRPHNCRCVRHRGMKQPWLGRTAAVE